ncbi:MAG: ATP-binding protein, partial [Terracidiphilus sp.]
MQQMEETIVLGEADRSKDGTERKRVERVMETLATLGSQSESVAEIAHDARNMVTALGLYCDLLEEPGVLAVPFTHYGRELRLLAAASRRLVEKLVALDARVDTAASGEIFPRHDSGRWPVLTATAKGQPGSNGVGRNSSLEMNSDRNRRCDLLPALPVANLAAELLANRSLLSALAGPAVALTVETQGGARPVRLTSEDLTRVLVNLVKNAAEAMSGGGRIHISLCERPAAAGTAACLALAIEDNGPGIPEAALEKIFTPGYTTRAKG